MKHPKLPHDENFYPILDKIDFGKWYTFEIFKNEEFEDIKRGFQIRKFCAKNCLDYSWIEGYMGFVDILFLKSSTLNCGDCKNTLPLWIYSKRAIHTYDSGEKAIICDDCDSLINRMIINKY